MNLIDKDALIEALGIETDCYDCEHETIIYHCDLDPVTVCEKIIQAPVITLTTESAEKAIEVLKNAAWLGVVYSFEETEEAVKTAITALQMVSNQYAEADKKGDMISRQRAIDAVENCEPGEELFMIKSMPSAQPEIIRCKDCKHYQFADNRAFGMPVKMCEWFGFEDVDDDDFCSFAERRTDE